ncbi:hypothetical protein [Ferruginibacter sp.]
MGIADLILYPVYLLLFYLFFSSGRKKLNDPVLQVYHQHGFWIKALAVIPFVLFNWKISPGDSYVLYQVEGVNIYKLILKDFSNVRFLLSPGTVYDESGLLADPWNLGYCRDVNNFTVCRIVTLLSFFSTGKYLITCLFFSMISFSGVWRLYRFFYALYPHLHKQLAIAILYLPTFVFWSSGILKDPLCTGALGWLTFALYEILVKKKNLPTNMFIIIAAGYTLVALKIYILVSYLPFFLLFLALKNLNLLKSSFAKITVGTIMLIGIMISFTRIMNQLQDSMVKFAGKGITTTIKNYQQNYAAQGDIAESNFSLGVEFDGSVSSLIKMAPAAVIATLYRPFIWETRKPSTLLSSLESLAIILLTLKAFRSAGIVKFFRLWTDPTIMYCIGFSLFFALFVGATTPNFGTLCRYKIPCMPFYVIAMFLILDITNKKKEILLKNKQDVEV